MQRISTINKKSIYEISTFIKDFNGIRNEINFITIYWGGHFIIEEKLKEILKLNNKKDALIITDYNIIDQETFDGSSYIEKTINTIDNMEFNKIQDYSIEKLESHGWSCTDYYIKLTGKLTSEEYIISSELIPESEPIKLDSLQLTDWFDDSIKPIHIGVYEVSHGFPLQMRIFANWNGTYWTSATDSISKSYLNSENSQRSWIWRGILLSENT
jgi:hypothetical protein